MNFTSRTGIKVLGVVVVALGAGGIVAERHLDVPGRDRGGCSDSIARDGADRDRLLETPGRHAGGPGDRAAVRAVAGRTSFAEVFVDCPLSEYLARAVYRARSRCTRAPSSSRYCSFH